MIIVNIISKQTMTDKKESQSYEIQLKIISVKMKIKFPCRMVLQLNKSPITKESTSSDQAKFIFNDNIVLKSQGDSQSFDVVANLLTQKGTKYAAGSLKLLGAELIRSKGERLVVPLTKCLDPQAFCELFVENITSPRQSQVKISRQSSKVIQSPQKPQLLSPTRKINSERFLVGETRSQVNFAPLTGLGSQQKHREVGPKSQIYKTFTKSPNSKFSTLKYVTVNNGNMGQLKSQFPIEQANSQRPSFDDGEIYRQGYHKLKQKFKQQSQLLKEQTRKRITLQASQNTLKLQIMKLRIKTQEQQKNIAEKTEKIRTLSSQLSQFQKKDIDLAYVREQCASLERKNKIQQETISGILHDNEQLKKLMVQKSKLDSQTIQGLRQQIQLANSKVDQLSYQIDAQIKAKDSIIQTKVSDVKIRNDTIQRQKNTIKELEINIEKKLLDFEKLINSQRNNTQSKVNQHKVRILSISQEKQLIEQKNSDLLNEIDRLLSTINSLQFNKKTQIDEINLLNCQIKDLKLTKDKFNELSKQHKFLQQQFSTVRKSLQATLSNKQVDLTHLLQQYQEGKLRNEKIKSQQDQKIKNLNNKIHEYQANQQILKNSLEKAKRINDGLTNENSQLRQQNRRLRDDLRKAQNRIISLQGQTTSWSSRSEREMSNLNSLLQKMRNEKSLLQRQLDRSQQLSQRQEQKIRQLQQKGHQWKLKERYYQQRHEKQTSKSKQATQRYDNTIKDQQIMLNENSTTIESLNGENRTLRKKINDLEINSIKDRESMQRMKKELKIYQQKNLANQQQIKQKNEQDRQKSQKIIDLEHIISQKQGQINKFKELQTESTKGAEKQSKIIQILNNDVTRLSKNIEQLTFTIRQKQKNEQKLRQNLKNQREEIVKQKIKTNRLQSQFDKFKDNISDIIRIQFTRILTTPSTINKNTQRLRESQVSIVKSQKSIKSKTSLDAGVLASNLMEKLHETKSSLWKMVQLNKLLKQQVNRLETHFENQTNRHQFAQLQLHRDIQLLEDEMNNLLQDKQAENVNYDNLVIELNMKLKDKEAKIQDLKTQIAEYDAIVKGLKTDFETNNQLNEKKVNSLRQSTSQLNQRIEYLNLNVACLQDKNHELQQKTIEQQNEIVSTKQMLIKNEKNLLDLKQSEEKLSIHVQHFKKQLKSIQERYVDLQMQFNVQKESKEKYIVMLQEQEKKCQKLNEFVKILMTQKQNAIKNEQEKVEQNTQLQNQLFELNHQRQIIIDQNKQLKQKIDDSKEQQKMSTKTIKGLQKQLSEQKSKNVRNTQKIKQRQNDLQIKKDYIKDLEDKYRELREKNYKQIRQLSNQLEDKNLIANTASKQLNEKIIKVQNQSKQYWQEALSLKAENQQLTQQIYSLKDRIEDLTLQISRNKEQTNTLQQELISREFSIQERTQEIKRLEDMVSEMRFRVENLQSQCQSQEKQFNHHIMELTVQYNDKIQQNSKEFNSKIIQLQEQYRISQQSLQKTQQSLQKALLQRNNSSLQNQQKQAIYQQRLKKVEAERMAGIQAKNSDIKKINDEYRICQQRLREKESEVRKISLHLEQKQVIQHQLQAKVHHLSEQLKNKEKVHQRQIQVLKSKEKIITQNRQKLSSNMSQAEQQTKRGIAQISKKISQLYQANQAQKIMPFFKIFESNILATFNIPSSSA